MDKSGYDFRIQRAEVDKEDINTSNNETIVVLCYLTTQYREFILCSSNEMGGLMISTVFRN
jgi:hypothetical protein